MNSGTSSPARWLELGYDNAFDLANHIQWHAHAGRMLEYRERFSGE
jgi:hypothetical protein